MSEVVTPLTQAMGDDAPISRRELKRLMKRSNVPGLIHLFWWCVLLAGTGTLIWAAGDRPLLLVPAMFLHGIVVVHHFALQHECSHYSAFRSRWLCDLLAGVCGFILVIPPRYFRYEHCDHHTYTNLTGRDPQIIALPTSIWSYLGYISSVPYWKAQFGGLVRRALGRLSDDERRFVPKVEVAAVVRESRLLIAGYLAIVAAMIAFEWNAPLFYWWLPMFLGEPVMRFIRMTEHVGRPTVADMRLNTRTNLVSAPWRFLAWNMSYHTEHHYAASVPFHALGALHERLKDHIEVEPRGYVGAHIDIVRQILGKSPRRAEQAGAA